MARRTAVAAVFLSLIAADARAGWTILAVEKSTRTIVIASASCVPQVRFANFPAKGLMDLQAIVAPGKGIAVAQAAVDRTRANHTLIYEALQKGTPPLEILQTLLASDSNIQSRQFAVLDVEGRSAGFTGTAAPPLVAEKQDKVDENVFFVIQGNSLSVADVIVQAAQTMKLTQGPLADRVMAAFEAGDSKGGDRRCSCSTQVPLVDGKDPLEKVPCEGKSSHVAYILRADATDANVASFNDGQYAMYISVTDQDITRKENANPIRTLRRRYDAWKAKNASGTKQ